MLESLIKRFTQRNREQSRARRKTVRQFALLAAKSELGIAADFDRDELLDSLTKEGLTPDFQANVELVKKRIVWADLAAQEPTLQASSEKLDAEWRTFDIAEAERHRKALKKLADMKAAAQQASVTYLDSFEAREKLKSTAAPPDDIDELNQQLAEINRKIAVAELALDAGDKHDDAFYRLASIESRPARLARQCRDALADMNTNVPADRRKGIKSQLAAAERAVAKREKELLTLKDEREALNERLSVKPDDWKRPENFALIRAVRSHDDQAKQRATELGWSDAQPTTSSVG